MEQDLRLLKYAMLEIKANSGDMVSVAGALQKIKDWWNARKNRKALQNIRNPVDLAFKKLDDAIRSHDTEAVGRISQELPEMLSNSIDGIGQIRDAMLSHTEDYVNKGGDTVADKNLGWVSKNYQKEKSLVEKLWEMLPVEFRSEIPVGRRIGQPISSFSWYKTYGPQDIYISNTVKDHLWKSLSRMFDAQTLDYLASGYDQFIENLKDSIINKSILVQVNFSPVSSQVDRRHANEMRIEVIPPEISYPAGTSELFIHIDKVILTDLGTRVSPKHQLSVLGVWPSLTNKFRGFKAPLDVQEQNTNEPHIASDGPITKIVKRSLLKKALPTTQAIVKINGQDFDYNVQFAKILSSALRQEIDAECSVRHRDNDIEIQADICGTKMASLPAIFGISKYLAEEFLNINKVGINIQVVPGISGFEVIESDILDKSFRKVAFDCWRMK